MRTGHQTFLSPLPAPPAPWFMDSVEMLGFTRGFYADATARMELKLAMLHRSPEDMNEEKFSQIMRHGSQVIREFGESLAKAAQTKTPFWDESLLPHSKQDIQECLLMTLSYAELEHFLPEVQVLYTGINSPPVQNRPSR
jgi:hypothetical protein